MEKLQVAPFKPTGVEMYYLKEYRNAKVKVDSKIWKCKFLPKVHRVNLKRTEAVW